MPPDTFRKAYVYGAGIKRLWAIARKHNVSPFVLFLGDADNVFGEREDHDKQEIFSRLAQSRIVAPYLAETVSFTAPHCAPTADLPVGMTYPIVLKPSRGMRAVGIVAVHDQCALRRFLATRRCRYVAQNFMRDGVEIAVSYTRNPAGSPEFFGIARKRPARWQEEWRNGLCRTPAYFHYEDWTHRLDRDGYLALCRAITETLRSNSIRFDAIVCSKDGALIMNSMRIIDVNIGVLSTDEFLLDTRHPLEFVIEQLVRRYTYVLIAGAKHSHRFTFAKRKDITLHYLYCYWLTLYYRIEARPVLSRLWSAAAGLFDRQAGNSRRSNRPVL